MLTKLKKKARQLPDRCGAITRAWRERTPSFTLHGTSSSRLCCHPPPHPNTTRPPPASTSETGDWEAVRFILVSLSIRCGLASDGAWHQRCCWQASTRLAVRGGGLARWQIDDGEKQPPQLRIWHWEKLIWCFDAPSCDAAASWIRQPCLHGDLLRKSCASLQVLFVFAHILYKTCISGLKRGDDRKHGRNPFVV